MDVHHYPTNFSSHLITNHALPFNVNKTQIFTLRNQQLIDLFQIQWHHPVDRFKQKNIANSSCNE